MLARSRASRCWLHGPRSPVPPIDGCAYTGRSPSGDRRRRRFGRSGSSGSPAGPRIRDIVLEKGDGVGSSWRSRYAELRLNSWRPMSKLQGRGMPRSYGRYPSRDDVVAYLESVRARSWALRAVRNPRPCRPSRRRPLANRDVDALDALPVSRHRHRVGHGSRHARHGRAPASYQKELMHSSQFANATAYAQRDVLVVGAGNSGFDIASHLVRAGARVTMSMRTPPNIAARDLKGIPGQPLLVYLADHLPENWPMRYFACRNG